MPEDESYRGQVQGPVQKPAMKNETHPAQAGSSIEAALDQWPRDLVSAGSFGKKSFSLFLRVRGSVLWGKRVCEGRRGMGGAWLAWRSRNMLPLGDSIPLNGHSVKRPRRKHPSEGSPQSRSVLWPVEQRCAQLRG